MTKGDTLLTAICGIRVARGVITFTSVSLLLSTPSFGELGNCLDFNPGIDYLSVNVDPTSVARPFRNPVGYALASTFSEQIAINNLRKKDDFFGDFAISSTKVALSAALGVGNDASFLFNPQDGSSANEDISLTFVPSEESTILSDKRGVIITNGLVNRISEDAIKTVFGSVANYKTHLNEMATHDYSRFLAANNVQTGVAEGAVPVGFLLFGKNLNGADPVVSSVAAFTNEFLSKLLFATAHEIGHIRLHHNETRYADCTDFEKREMAADQYATRFLAGFVFRMEPDDFEKQKLINFESFFQGYDVYEFSGKSAGGDCAYPSARKREKEMRKSLYREAVKLKQQTFSSPDIATPTPTSVICHNDKGSWRVYFGDQLYVEGDEMRRRSIEESKKVGVGP